MKQPYKFKDLVEDLEKNKPLENEFDGYQSIWDEASNYSTQSFDSTRNWEQLKKQIDTKPQRFLTNKGFWKIAASLLIITLVGIALVQFGSLNNAQSQLMVSANNSDTIMKIILNDQSIVLLKPQSVIKTDPKFNDNHRNVILEGDATFHVQKSTIPFVVVSNRLSTKVLGTVFEVSQHPNKEALVKVFEGKVQVFLDKKPVTMLTKGKMATVNLVNNKSEIAEFTLDSTPNTLIFEQVKLEVIIATLEEIYGMPITYPAHLKNDLITTTLPVNDFNACLQILSATVGQQIVGNP